MLRVLECIRVPSGARVSLIRKLSDHIPFLLRTFQGIFLLISWTTREVECLFLGSLVIYISSHPAGTFSGGLGSWEVEGYFLWGLGEGWE